MPELVLSGCGLEPLGDYLKAIGVLRLLGSQVDPTITGRWVGDEFVLTTDLSRDDVVEFLMTDYVPTPIITPWNSGSGFGADDASKSKTAFEAVEVVAASTTHRLERFRRSIGTARWLAAQPGWGSLDKQVQVALCRNTMPDEMVDWIDAAVVLTTESRSFPPLLGTGGNDGRLDFGSNVMQRLIDVLALGPKPRTAEARASMLGDALFGDRSVTLDRSKPGQFDPFAAGGPNSSPLGSTQELSNPWGFLMTFEGAIAFASGTARKLGVGGSAGSVSAVPFTSLAVGAAYGSAASENSRGEFWAPVWDRAVTWRELERTIAEARVDFRGRAARSGVDFVRAISTYGTDRGIDRFVRYGFLERNGLATFCVPLGRHRASRSERVQVSGQVDGWVNGVRRAANAPAAVQSLLRRIDGRLFATASNDDALALQELLHDVAALERLASRSRAAREAVGRPLIGLAASDWLPLLDDKSPEFQIAAGLASLRVPKDRWGLIRRLVADVEWQGKAPKVTGFGHRPLTEVLAECVVRLARRASAEDSGWCGPTTAIWVPPGPFVLFARREVDIGRLERLLSGLMVLDWRQVDWKPNQTPGSLSDVPAAMQLLQPAFHHRGLRSHLPSGRRLVPEPDVPRLLAGNQVERAIESTLRSLRVAGCEPAVVDARPVALGMDGRHLAATCLVPINDQTSLGLLQRVSNTELRTESELPT